MAGEPLRTRRRVVGVSTVSVLVWVSGCLLDTDTESVPVFVENDDQTTHELSLVLQFGDDTLLERTVDVESNGESDLSFENPDDGGDATLQATITDGDTVEETFAVGPGSGIDSIQITIGDDGNVTVAVAVR